MQEGSNGFETGALHKFLFNIDPVREIQVFMRIRIMLFHIGSFLTEQMTMKKDTISVQKEPFRLCKTYFQF